MHDGGSESVNVHTGVAIRRMKLSPAAAPGETHQPKPQQQPGRGIGVGRRVEGRVLIVVLVEPYEQNRDVFKFEGNRGPP